MAKTEVINLKRKIEELCEQIVVPVDSLGKNVLLVVETDTILNPDEYQKVYDLIQEVLK